MPWLEEDIEGDVACLNGGSRPPLRQLEPMTEQGFLRKLVRLDKSINHMIRKGGPEFFCWTFKNGDVDTEATLSQSQALRVYQHVKDHEIVESESITLSEDKKVMRFETEKGSMRVFLVCKYSIFYLPEETAVVESELEDDAVEEPEQELGEDVPAIKSEDDIPAVELESENAAVEDVETEEQATVESEEEQAVAVELEEAAPTSKETVDKEDIAADSDDNLEEDIMPVAVDEEEEVPSTVESEEHESEPSIEMELEEEPAVEQDLEEDVMPAESEEAVEEPEEAVAEENTTMNTRRRRRHLIFRARSRARSKSRARSTARGNIEAVAAEEGIDRRRTGAAAVSPRSPTERTFMGNFYQRFFTPPPKK